jgi:hypothetical protein
VDFYLLGLQRNLHAILFPFSKSGFEIGKRSYRFDLPITGNQTLVRKGITYFLFSMFFLIHR